MGFGPADPGSNPGGAIRNTYKPKKRMATTCFENI